MSSKICQKNNKHRLLPLKIQIKSYKSEESHSPIERGIKDFPEIKFYFNLNFLLLPRKVEYEGRTTSS